MAIERHENTGGGYSDQLVERFEQGVLAEMQAYPNFVVWRPLERNGRITKPPISPLTGKFADTTDPSTWGTFNQALRAVATGKVAGLGFVFSPDDPFCGVDLDHVLNPEIDPQALKAVRLLDSYTELSPSGTGLHVIVQAELPEGGRRRDHIELYDRNRFFTITTNHLAGTPESILPRQEAVTALYESLAPPQHSQAKEMRPRAEYSLTRRDDEVLEKAMKAKNGESFRQLWSGDTGGFKSKSEADFTLILRLLYWTGNNTQQTERLFRQSALYDEKTDRPIKGTTYLSYTIQNALKKRK